MWVFLEAPLTMINGRSYVGRLMIYLRKLFSVIVAPSPHHKTMEATNEFLATIQPPLSSGLAGIHLCCFGAFSQLWLNQAL